VQRAAHLLSLPQELFPSLPHAHLASLLHAHLASLLHAHLPSLLHAHLPSLQQGHAQSLPQVHLPSLQQVHLPSLQQAQAAAFPVAFEALQESPAGAVASAAKPATGDSANTAIIIEITKVVSVFFMIHFP